jgi:membrane-bound lytic murein transglycosylase D
MDWKTSKKQILFVFVFLGMAGCATAPKEPTPQAEVANPAPPAVTAAAPAASTSLFPRTDMVAAEPANEAQSAAKPADLAKQDYPDIWARIRAGFGMKHLDGNPQVEREIRWFQDNPEFMQAMMERARLYLYYITDEVQKRGMPTEIALLPAIESAYKPYAYSRARAVGLWQFIPSTGRLYGLKANWWYDGRRDVQASTQAALDYLEKLYNDFDGDWHLALAAYNAGEGKIARMIDYNRRRGLPTDYEHLKLKRETRDYVPKLMAMVEIVSHPDKYGIKLADIPNAPYFTRVETDSQVDLGVVAKLVDMPVDDLHKINAGYTRWATDPNGPHHLLVPVDKKDDLLEGLNNLPENERVQWLHHQVRRGDTMSRISHRYGVSIEVIRTANKLRSNLLRVGQDLLIPLSARAMRPPVVRAAYRPFAGRTARGEPIIHRVRSGETLWSIARRYNVLVRQLVQWNQIDLKDVLRLGQRIKIWPTGGPTASIADETPEG